MAGEDRVYEMINQQMQHHNDLLQDIQSDLSDVKTSVAVLEHKTGNVEVAPNRKKDTAIGSGIGTMIGAGLYAAYEFISKLKS